MEIGSTFLPVSSQCPFCKSGLVFSSVNTNFQVCKQCESTIHRNEKMELVRFPLAKIKYQNEAIQVGTKGQYSGKSFIVIGRMQVWNSETAYNYWTLHFQSGDIQLLGEGYGIFGLYTPLVVPDYLPTDNKNKQISKGNYKGENFYLKRSEFPRILKTEGEFYFPVVNLIQNETIQISEYSSNQGTDIEIWKVSKQDPIGFKIEFIESKALNLSKLRTNFHDFSTACPKCAEVNKLEAFPYSQSFVCKTCQTPSRINGKEETNEISLNLKPLINQDIKLSDSFNLYGIYYKVLGCCQKMQVGSDNAIWNEYTLFNHLEGFAFLTEFEGHWIYLREKGHTPVRTTTARNKPIIFEGKDFVLYNKYNYKVYGAKGEFPGNHFDDLEVSSYEYIKPPEMWSLDVDSTEGNIWYHGLYQSRKELSSQVDRSFKWATGTGTLEPISTLSPKQLVSSAVIGTIALILIFLVSILNLEDKEVYRHSFYPLDQTGNGHFESDVFTVNHHYSNVEVHINADLYNNWEYFGITLLNLETGEEYFNDLDLEYYSGYDDEGPWSEGSQVDDVYFVHIPKGKYQLKFHVMWGLNGASPKGASIVVKNDTVMPRNLLFSILLFAFPLILLVIRNHYKEVERWDNSQYDNY